MRCVTRLGLPRFGESPFPKFSRSERWRGRLAFHLNEFSVEFSIVNPGRPTCPPKKMSIFGKVGKRLKLVARPAREPGCDASLFNFVSVRRFYYELRTY